MKAAKITSLLIISIITSTLWAQQEAPKNWYHGDKTAETPFNIGTESVYKNILKGKQGAPVIVAVIDSGVDIEHEDLVDAIWQNPKEIPGNGIDDDNNGYIDDINGWNFIGGADGSQVGADTFEETRAYAELRKKYGNIEDPSSLGKKEKEEYALFQKYGNKIEQQAASAKKEYDELLGTEQLLNSAIDYIETLAVDDVVSAATLDSIGQIPTRDAAIASNLFANIAQVTGEVPTISQARALLAKDLEGAKKYYGHRWKYQYNPDYDSRDIVGDDYDDLKNKYYGNNSVEGPDAMHGTHVSGIIAATRNNDIGINGISNTAKIMVLRAVPDGDERDKDVANAIRYAVDNGASIINMSFGKGLSPQKQYVDDAVRYAEKNDVLLVHAAGNSHENIDSSANFPTDKYLKPKGFLFWKKKKSKNWISVGASSNNNTSDMVAGFSNYGKQNVDLFAPGEFMLSTTPDNTYEVQQGTSMAAPVVSGVAALIRSYFPTLKAHQVKEILMETSVPLDALVKRPGSDDTLVPFKDLSVSGGIVDLKAALLKAAQTKGKKKIKKSKGQA